jgi:peptidoglycan-N-acetylglucosamine deacetylase
MSIVIQQLRSRWMVRVIVWVMGAVLLVGGVAPGQREPLQPAISQSPVGAEQSMGHLPHGLHRAPSPTPAPTPAPITPFPLSLEDQISVLQAHGRFFYEGNHALGEVALTFDDGPNPPYTTQVLAILKQYGIQATFFCVGSQVARYPDLVRQEAAAGHTIGNHSWSHPFLTSLSTAQISSELTMTGDIIEQVTGTRPTFFRPPYGAVNARVLAQVNQLGLTTFIWSDDSLDWTGSAPSAITQLVLSTVTNGAIIIMHDGGGNRSRTVAALPSIIEGLQARHFRLVTLDQLVADANLNPPADQPGGLCPHQGMSFSTSGGLALYDTSGEAPRGATVPCETNLSS